MQFRELIGVPPNLPPCLGVTSHMLMGPPSSATISRASSFPFSKYVKNEIPNYFNHQKNGNLISFLIGLVRVLIDLVSSKRPTILFLMETKLLVDEMIQIRDELGYQSMLAVPSVRQSGGLALLWKDGVTVRISALKSYCMMLCMLLCMTLCMT